jgi:hypothetical protein
VDAVPASNTNIIAASNDDPFTAAQVAVVIVVFVIPIALIC